MKKKLILAACFAGLLFGTVYGNANSNIEYANEMCSGIYDEKGKEDCFKVFSKDNPGPYFGGWSFSGSAVKKVGEKPSFFAFRETNDSVREKPRSGSPFLIFGCSNGTGRLLLNLSESIGASDEFGVSYWVDREPEVSAIWKRSETGSVLGVWEKKEALDLLNFMKNHDRFLVRIDLESPVYFTVDLNGLSDTFDRVSNVCEWNESQSESSDQ